MVVVHTEPWPAPAWVWAKANCLLGLPSSRQKMMFLAALAKVTREEAHSALRGRLLCLSSPSKVYLCSGRGKFLCPPTLLIFPRACHKFWSPISRLTGVRLPHRRAVKICLAPAVELALAPYRARGDAFGFAMGGGIDVSVLCAPSSRFWGAPHGCSD